ncbi:MAG: radical SAM protein, partial [Chloroflexi bacterium]|nr:radical SAM protein [Chloroflexota bacterium]
MSTAIKIPSVNFHLWRPCNMKCGFCFATFQDIDPDNLPKGHIGRDDCISVVEALGEAGFQKINFAGGEPTLCPWLSELITRASDIGLVTSIVTNGSRITPDWLQSVEGHLDWTALSIATVLSELDLKGLLSGSERELRLPGCSVSHHRVEYRQQLPHTRHQRD